MSISTNKKSKSKLIFMHLPKCGGNTFHPVLERIYRSSETFTIRVVNNSSLNTDELINLDSRKKESLRLVKGHTEFGIHNYLIDEWKYITFLRNPVERVISYYYYVKRRPDHRLYKQRKFYQNMTLKDFVLQIKEPDINNGQIRFISGIQANPSEMLEIALENIEEHFVFVGTIEKFNESLLLLQNRFKWPNLYYSTKNKTNNRPRIESIDPTVIQVIIDQNKEDIELYEAMSKKLSKQLSTVKNFPQILKRFEHLNRIYQYPIRGIDFMNGIFHS